MNSLILIYNIYYNELKIKNQDFIVKLITSFIAKQNMNHYNITIP